MSLENTNNKNTEQQKPEQKEEFEKNKTVKEALDMLKAQKEGKEFGEQLETSNEKSLMGKEALDFVKQEKQSLGRLEPGEVRRTLEGSIIMCNEVRQATDRKGYEKMLFSATQVGLEGWHRAHSQGAGLGNEMREGILYAPPEVNLKLQNQGIEQHIRDIRDQLNPAAKLLLTTETKAHEGSRRLKSIDYKLEVEINGKRTRLYEASIEVENKRDNPKVTVSATPYTDNLESFLKPIQIEQKKK